MRLPAFLLGPEHQAQLDRDAEAQAHRACDAIDVVVWTLLIVGACGMVVGLGAALWRAWEAVCP